MPAFEPGQNHDADRWLAAIVESSNDAIISFTHDGSIISWNPAATRMFGYSAAEIVGQPLSLLVLPEHVDEHIRIFAHAHQSKSADHVETVWARTMHRSTSS